MATSKHIRTLLETITKDLQHNGIGEVDPTAYQAFLSAVHRGTWDAFESIPLGGGQKLVNPLAGQAFDLEGTDLA